MMLKTWRGLMLAAGVAAAPAFAQAECPPQDSIDRYAQTARDALVALDGLVPEEQQQALEARYIAMSVLRWNWQGRDAILNEASALDGIAECIDSGVCDSVPGERSGAGPRTIAPFPSDRLVSWANRQLDCEAPGTVESVIEPDAVPTEIEPEPEDPAEFEPDIAETIESPADPASDDAPPELVEPTPLESEIFADADSIVEETLASETLEGLALVEPLPDDTTGDTTGPIDIAIDEGVAEIDQAPAPVPATTPALLTGNSEYLVRTAILQVMRGNVPGGIEAISEACFQAAEQADPVQTCELIFDHYDRLAVRADPIEFLAFTDRLCRVNYTRGCDSLATYFGVETTVEAHLAALRFYDRACNNGDAEACAAASDYFLTGRAEPPDPVRARDTLFRSCDLGRLESCQSLAEFYAGGVGGEADLDRAMELNDISCSNAQTRSAETCVAAAKFVLVNMEGGDARDEKVHAYAERACRIGHDVGCAWHADNLEFGIGAAVDLQAAEQARYRACELGHEASCEATS